MNTDDEKVSELYHEAEAPVPPEKLDDTILSASRKAVEKPVGKVPFSGAWPAAASVAAIIVIAVIIVPVLRQEESLQRTERVSADKGIPAELADEASLKLDSANKSGKELMMPSTASQPVLVRQQDTPAAEQARPVSSAAPSPAARTSGLGKSSNASEQEQKLEADIDKKVYSRMEAADSAPFAALTPEMWVIKITQLIEDDELEQAKAELAKLEQHFPNYQIDQALLEKLEP